MAKGPFSEVEALLKDGRVKEAASALKRSASAGGAAWEMVLWMGRIEEKKGRLEEAERFYRNCLKNRKRVALRKLPQIQPSLRCPNHKPLQTRPNSRRISS